MDTAKIQLSPVEMELVMNADWILTKNHIIKKVMTLLASVQSEQKNFLENFPSIPKEVIQTSAKISKGENYLGLPYLILDQPRCFNKENVFAIRHLFWWGNFFSSTLHLSGIYKEKYQQHIIDSFEQLKESGVFVCINTHQWHHHFEENNFIPVSTITAARFEENTRNSSFIKLSKKISLKEWNTAEEKLSAVFKQYVSMLV